MDAIKLILVFVFATNFLNVILMLFDWSPDEPIIIYNWTVRELFHNRNFFGISLSVMICLLFLPSISISFFVIAISKVFSFIGTICDKIWSAGNRSKS